MKAPPTRASRPSPPFLKRGFANNETGADPYSGLLLIVYLLNWEPRSLLAVNAVDLARAPYDAHSSLSPADVTRNNMTATLPQ